MTDVLLGDETFGEGEFPALYRQAGGLVLAPQQLPRERRSWKDDLYAYRKETIELLFQRVTQTADLKECQVKGEGRKAVQAIRITGRGRVSRSLFGPSSHYLHVSPPRIT